MLKSFKEHDWVLGWSMVFMLIVLSPLLGLAFIGGFIAHALVWMVKEGWNEIS